jgi:phosphoglycolate phosphatase
MNKRGAHLIALDLDGTLEDSRADMIASVHRVRAAFKLAPKTDDAFFGQVNRGMETLYRSCFSELFEGDTVELFEGDTVDEKALLQTLTRAYETDYSAHIADQTRLYDGMAEALEELRLLGHLAIVTNKPESLSTLLLDKLEVRSHFQAIIGGDTCAESKPSAVPYGEAARRCAFDPAQGQAFMIGDTAGDIACGRAFGALTIWCAWGYTDEPGANEPHFRASHPLELPALIRAHL